MAGGQVIPPVEGIIERADNGLFDFCAAEVLARVEQGVQVELFRVAAAFGEVDPEHFSSLHGGRQVDEENLVKTTFAQQLGRELRNVVGGGYDEDGRALLREPGQESAKHAGGRSAIRAAGALGTGEGLVDFVDP